jgi:hypothetical protein
MAPKASLTYMSKTHGRYVLVFVKILDFPTSKHINSVGGIFLKDEVEQQQLLYFKNKVFTITGTG